jgi:hypothetical protein
MDLMKPKKPKSQRLFQRIKRKIQDVASDVRQKRRSKSSYKQNKKVKDFKAPKKKTTLADKRIERLKPISKEKKAVRSGRMEGRKDINVKSLKPTFRAKRAERTIERIEKRKKRRAMKMAKADASGPTSRTASQGIQCGPKGCAVK